MSSEGSELPDMERMHINSGCDCDYAVEYDEFLTSLKELTATPEGSAKRSRRSSVPRVCGTWTAVVI